MRSSFSATSGAGVISGSVGGEGGDLLVIHGGPGLSDYTDLLADETQEWRSIRYQQRGLAPSTPDGPFDVARHVADARAVLDEVEVERTVVLGHSWGGHLALQLALAHPERVRSVVVVDAMGSTDDGGAPALGAELRRRLPHHAVARTEELDLRLAEPDATDAEALESLALLWPGYFADPANAPALPGDTRLSLACAVGTFASVMPEISDGSFARRLSHLTMPVVVLVGQSSPMPVDVGEKTAGLVSHGELTVVPGAGHLPWYEQPGCVARALTRAASFS